MRPRHGEAHRTAHVGWLRAAVLGANDGIVSTASLVLGVAATHAGASTCWSRARRASSPARCRWPLASTSRSARRPIPSRRT